MSTATQPQVVATVVSVTGVAFARSADGAVRRLSVGDTILQGETVFTLADGQIELAFADGHHATILPSESYSMGPEAMIATSPTPGESAIADAGEVEKVVQALEEGGDILESLEPTAAGPGAGGGENGGNSFVRLLRITEDVNPVSFRFPLNDIGPIEAPSVEGGPEEEPPPPNFLPGAGETGATVDDEGLPGGILGGTGDLDANAGETPITLSESIYQGALPHDFGGDGPGEVNFSAMDGQTATVGTENVTYSWDDATDTLTATVTGGGRNGTELFTVQVNPATGEYTVTLLDNVLHESLDGLPGDDTENNASVSLTYSVTDSNGDTANGSLSVNFDDDIPTAHADTNSVSEGGTISGNVLPNDAFGADGATAGGGVVGVRAAGGDTTTAVTSGVGTTIAGQYGTLTLSANGTYSYASNADSITSDVQDVFVYTIQDSDGDLSTTTLTINVNDITIPPPPPDNVPVLNLVQPDAVDEAGLPERESEPAGSDEIADGDGTDNDVNSETTTGSFTYSSGDAPATVTINGVEVTGVGQTFAGVYGTLTITAFSAGSVSYSYTLADNTSGDVTHDDFTVVVTDVDGDATAPQTIVINIIDDVPTAEDDTDHIGAGEYGPATGNVITDAEGDGGADTEGADSATVTAIASNNVPANTDITPDGSGDFQVNGQYGVLTINEDGSYSYTRNAGTPGGVSDVFTYTLTDGDGDTDTATLTISIGNTPPLITNLTPEAQGGDVTVDEDDLLASRGAGESEGSDPLPKDNLVQAGTFNISAPDGVLSLTIGGNAFITNGVFTGGSFTTGLGNTLTIISYNSGTGQISYSYTLADNETHVNANGENSLFENFTVVLTDLDNESDTDTLSVKIVDDVPDAVNDGPLAVAEDTALTFGVFGNDVFGADGVDTDNNPVNTIVTWTQPSHGTVSYDANTGQFTYTPTTGYGGTDSFTYTITDGDGDQDTATVSLTVAPDSTPQIVSVEHLTVDEDGFAGDAQTPANVDSGLATETDSTELLSDSGTLRVNFYNDVPSNLLAAITLVDNGSLDGQLTSLGQPVTFDLVSGDLVGTINGGTVEVIRIEITGATDNGDGTIDYDYSVTLSEPVQHADVGNNENTITLTGVDFTATDSDGDPVSGSFNVNIVDDVPVTEDDYDELTIDLNGNGSTSGDVQSNDGMGADGPATGTSGAVTSVTFDGTTYAVPAGGSTAIQGDFGDLTIYSDGTYTYDYDREPVLTYVSIGVVDINGATLTAFDNTSPYTGNDLNLAAIPDALVDIHGGGGANKQGFGVKGDGGAGTLDEGEELVIELSEPILGSFTFQIGEYNANQSELGDMTWGVYGADGHLIASGTFADLNGTPTANGTYTGAPITFNEAVSYIVFGMSDTTGSGYTVTNIAYTYYDYPTGTDDFTYTVTDGDGDTSSSHLYITSTEGNGATALQGLGEAARLVMGDSEGSDVFAWTLADAGTSGSPALDIIANFDVAAAEEGGDVLDLSDLLQSESNTASSLENYLSFTLTGDGDTVVHVSSTSGGPEVQTIVLQGVDLVTGVASDQAIIQNLLDGNKLITD